MAVFRGVSFLCAVLLCITLCTDLHARRFPRTAARSSSTVFLPNIPRQCRVSDDSYIKGRLDLRCSYASLSEILQTMKAIGNKLATIVGVNCFPREVVSLNASCFENHANLKRLTLSSCGVANIADGTFAGLGNLYLLDLESNVISAVTTGMLSGLDHLQILEMSGNRIVGFPPNFFLNTPNLDILYLPDNRIKKLGSDTFHGLSKLSSLHLSYNQMDNIDHAAFRGLHSLSVLAIGSNEVMYIQRGIFKQIKDLNQLFLSYNIFWMLQDYVFSDLHVLEKLTFTLNPILDSEYHNPRPKIFAGLQNLKHITLSGSVWGSLQHSDLNLLFEDQWDSLTHFTCKRCRINNRLLYMIKNLRHLDYLSLADNELTYIDQFSFPSNRTNNSLQIDLKNNKITYIDVRVFEGMTNRLVFLARNALDCSCKHAGFSRWLRSARGARVVDRDEVFCGSPVELAGTKVMDYDPYWWQCSEYIPLVALVFFVCVLLIVSLIILIVYCNRINLQHWILQRRVASMPTEEVQNTEEPTENAPPLNPALCRNPSRQGKTGAYIIHDCERSMQDWVNKYLEDQLHNHPMKITLQFPAGPEVIPLWKQVKDFSFQVHAFLVLVTDQFLVNHWPEIAEKSGVDNIMKCVFVLHGMKTSELPKEMKRLQCPCFQWPETGTRFTSLERERDQFWKQVRLAVKVVKK